MIKLDFVKNRVCIFGLLLLLFALFSCSDYFKNDYDNNTPTSGKLKVYYDEGTAPHIKNQVYTFQALYPNAQIDLFQVNDNKAVDAMYYDSCDAIVISRQLSPIEKEAFASKQYTPSFSAVAKSGILVFTNSKTSISKLSVSEIQSLLSIGRPIKDSAGNDLLINVLFDKNNSSVMNYMLDSVIKTQKLSSICNSLHSSLECINYVANNVNTLAFIDFSWLSDTDDSLVKANKTKIKVLPIQGQDSENYYFPDQSNFKLGLYPFTRTIYVYRKTGDFTLAKGFESFVAGPKGQLTFLKQGLLPTRQSERALEIKTEAKTDKIP